LIPLPAALISASDWWEGGGGPLSSVVNSGQSAAVSSDVNVSFFAIENNSFFAFVQEKTNVLIFFAHPIQFS
jgi:hypothetical protein